MFILQRSDLLSQIVRTFEEVAQTKTKTIHSDETIKPRLNLRQGELINKKGKTETVLVKKVTFNPHITS